MELPVNKNTCKEAANEISFHRVKKDYEKIKIFAKKITRIPVNGITNE